MGGLFRSPKPVIVQTAPAAAAPEAAGATTEAAAQAEASQARSEARARAARGLAGTIATSARGVLDPLPAGIAAARKSLLGE